MKAVARPTAALSHLGEPVADYFVQNLIGADAQRGIDLFESLSGLKVHDRLRRSEMSGQTRLMNGNRRDAPHVVNQHGVWIKTFPSKSELGDNGAMTVMLEKGVVGHPGKVKGIGLLERGTTESVFSQPFNLPASNQSFAYDRAVAHELLHSVGVEHHGSGDYNLIAGYVSPKNPFNTIGRPYYGAGPKEPIDLRDEGGRDIAARDYPDYVKFRQFGEMALGERLLAEGRKFIADRAGPVGPYNQDGRAIRGCAYRVVGYLLPSRRWRRSSPMAPRTCGGKARILSRRRRFVTSCGLPCACQRRRTLSHASSSR